MSVVLWCDKGPLEHPIHRSAESIRHLTWIDRVGSLGCYTNLALPCPAHRTAFCRLAVPASLLIAINNSTLHRIPELINSSNYTASYQTYCCASVDQRQSFSSWYLCFILVGYPVRYLSAAFGWGFSVHSLAVKVYYCFVPDVFSFIFQLSLNSSPSLDSFVLTLHTHGAYSYLPLQLYKLSNAVHMVRYEWWASWDCYSP
jgi:hypothetical protein